MVHRVEQRLALREAAEAVLAEREAMERAGAQSWLRTTPDKRDLARRRQWLRGTSAVALVASVLALVGLATNSGSVAVWSFQIAALSISGLVGIWLWFHSVHPMVPGKVRRRAMRRFAAGDGEERPVVRGTVLASAAPELPVLLSEDRPEKKGHLVHITAQPFVIDTDDGLLLIDTPHIEAIRWTRTQPTHELLRLQPGDAISVRQGKREQTPAPPWLEGDEGDASYRRRRNIAKLVGTEDAPIELWLLPDDEQADLS